MPAQVWFQVLSAGPDDDGVYTIIGDMSLIVTLDAVPVRGGVSICAAVRDAPQASARIPYSIVDKSESFEEKKSVVDVLRPS
jgi:hypothetical protein